MKRIEKYNEHLLEREFASIMAEIMLVAEAQTGANTFEWDLRAPKAEPKKDFNIKDKKEFEIGDTVEFDIEPKKRDFNIKDKKEFEIGDTVEFDIEQKKRLKDYLDFVKSKAKELKGYIGEKDPRSQIDSISVDKMKDLLQKMFDSAPSKEEAMAKAKEYFDRIVFELKALPYEIKRSIAKKFVYVFMVFIPLANLMPDSEIKDSTLKEIKTEIMSKSKAKQGNSSFDVAQKFVAVEEGGYTDFRRDKGNWTSNHIGEGLLIGTNHGISAPTLIEADILPSGKEGKYFKMCYGSDSNYKSLCGEGRLTFAEQWKKDKKHITRSKDIETKWKKIMENLSYDTALEIFEGQYWNSQNLGLFDNQSIANLLYDGCVNQGPGAMAKALAESAEELGLSIEGEIFSEESIKKINGLDQEKLFEKIKEKRKAMYENNDRFDDFGEGWLDRLSGIEFGGGENKDIA